MLAAPCHPTPSIISQLTWKRALDASAEESASGSGHLPLATQRRQRSLRVIGCTRNLCGNELQVHWAGLGGGGGGARISREGCEAEMNLAGYSCSKFWGCLAESSMAEHGEAWRRLL